MKFLHLRTIPALVASTLNSSFIGPRESTDSSCYNYELPIRDIARAEQFGFEVANGTAICEILPNIKHSGHLVHVGEVFVSLTSRDGEPHRQPCAYLADSVRLLRDQCGVKGGTLYSFLEHAGLVLTKDSRVGWAVANHDGNIIVHVENKWNNMHGSPS